MPGEVDGQRVRVGCDVLAIEDVQDSLAAFGDRYLRKAVVLVVRSGDAGADAR
jgi:hypothetical protein